MNEISTVVKTYAVVTYTGVHYLITESQENQLRNLGLNDEIDIDGNIVKMKNIADILTIQKYYETYPDRKPDSRFNLPEEYYNPPQKPRTKEQRIKEQNSLLKGLKDELDMAKVKNQPYQKMEALYKERLRKLLRLQNGDTEVEKPQVKKTEFVNVKQINKNSFAEILKNYAE